MLRDARLKEVAPTEFNSGAEFQVEFTPTGPVKLGFKFSPTDASNRRAPGRAFPLVVVTTASSQIVSRGQCNYVPWIDQMRDMRDPVLRARCEALERVNAAQMELAQAEAALRSL